MKKEIILISILTVFMFVAISFASAASNKSVEKKASPLYKLRTIRAAKLKIKEIIQSRFTQNHLFLFTGEQIENENALVRKAFGFKDLVRNSFYIGYLTACAPHC